MREEQQKARERALQLSRFGFLLNSQRQGPDDYLCEFDHQDLERAKRSILWFDDWEEATAATLDIFRALNLLADGQTVVDYGCGVGRISRGIMANYRLDRSPWMLTHATNYLIGGDLITQDIRLWFEEKFQRNLDALRGKIDLIFLRRGLATHTRNRFWTICYPS